MNENKVFLSGPKEEEKVFIIGLVQNVEGLVIEKFSDKDKPNEITISFDDIKNIATKEELNNEEIEAIIKFLSDKKYTIEVNREKQEFKIKMPKELSENGY